MTLHVEPSNDLREHITNGEPCPCIPRTYKGMIVHNSYDGREVGEICVKALKLLGVALAGHNHIWTDDEREYFEHAMQILEMHWAKPGRDL